MTVKYRVIDDQVYPCPFYEDDQYPKFKGGENGHEAETVYYVSNAYVSILAKWLVQRTEWDAGTSTINVYPGHMIPTYPLAELRCYACDIEPFGANLSSNTYHTTFANWKITAYYKVQPANKLLIIYDEQSQETSEYLAGATNGFYWDAAKTLPLDGNDAPGRVLRGTDIEIRYKNIPLGAVPAVGALQGTTNAASVTMSKYNDTFAIGTLLFGSVEFEYSYSYSGEEAISCTMGLSYRADTWNKFPRSGTAALGTIYNSSGSAVTIYGTGDFTLFKPELVA